MNGGYISNLLKQNSQTDSQESEDQKQLYPVTKR